MVFGGAGAALDGEFAGAADGGGEEFGEHGFCGAGFAYQHECPAAGEGDDAAFDEGPVTDKFGGDVHSGWQFGVFGFGVFV